MGMTMRSTQWIRTVLFVIAIVANGVAAAAQVPWPEVAFDPTSGTVRLDLSVDDVRGFSIPHLRPSSFVVFEDGVRQEHANASVEHSPITLAVLVELGGRSTQLNRMLTTDAVYAARPVLDVLGPDDKFGLFTYADRLHTIVDFDTPHDKWREAVTRVHEARFSEANFYDAAIEVLDRLAPIRGRKALLVISTGIDTFSHRTFDDVLKTAKGAQTPVYVIDLAESARRRAADVVEGPLSRVDWKECARRLQMIANSSGGRWYTRGATIDTAAIFDDMIETLRVRYVITYVSPQPSAKAMARSVEVRVVDAAADASLRSPGSAVPQASARVIAQASYTPTMVSARLLGASGE